MISHEAHQGERGRSSGSNALSTAAATVMQCDSKGSLVHFTFRIVKTLNGANRYSPSPEHNDRCCRVCV